MNFRTISSLLTGLLAIAQFSTSAHAALPEACFKSKHDYELYLKHSNNTQSVSHSDGEFYAGGAPEEDEVPQKKTITINVDHTTSAGKIISNASRSSTPSGEKRFFWGTLSAPSSRSAEYTSNAGTPGTHRNIELTVQDPVCDVKASTQVRIYSQ
ncbi:hypothetical protein [Pseudomonas japonica]|uniref:Adhesin n=1 Tax=Pseudomonas japonica TaxID=256466 RepID=A0A239J9M1_9PSED|nr:hypothetical protein [Pseudomonas japonica]SNT02591.1 hypothetical protein SAMN05444352_12184 [Pseudomonas japonica]